MLPVTTGVAINCLEVVSHNFVTSQTLHLLTHAGVGVKQETKGEFLSGQSDRIEILFGP